MIKNFLYRVFCGFFLGLSIFAPGFSGSVIAIIMGVYQDMLRIVSNPFKKLKENILFCLPLGIGALISGVLFIIAFQYLFETYEKATYLLFVGLIAGNMPVIYSEIKDAGIKKHYYIGAACAFTAALALGLYAASFGAAEASSIGAAGASSAGVVNGTGGAGAGLAAAAALSLPRIALGGFAGGVTAFIPGMSVSMVLIVSGVYNQVISMAYTLLHLDLTYLMPFALFGVCALAGIVLASRAIKAVFEKYPGLANSLVFGFMAGSLVGVLIRSLQLEDANFTWLSGGAMLAAGLGVSMLFVVLGKHMKKS